MDHIDHIRSTQKRKTKERGKCFNVTNENIMPESNFLFVEISV